MATMDGVWAKLLADGQAALQAKDPARLEIVVQDMTTYNKIQSEIDDLEKAVDGISPPSVPNISIQS